MKNVTIYPSHLHGSIPAIPSKSAAHREIIKAAFAAAPTRIHLSSVCDDVAATIAAIRAIGAKATFENGVLCVTPVCFNGIPKKAVINCRSSASTLRFFIPIVCALGIETEFIADESLRLRPVKPLVDTLKAHGAEIASTEQGFVVSGRLQSGEYRIDGGISSQYITGLTFALPLVGNSTLHVIGDAVSKPYIKLTKSIIDAPHKDDVYVEGDWSCGAFFLAAGVEVNGLDKSSIQGDKAILDLLESDADTFDVSDTPDLAPVAACIFAGKNRTSAITGCSRLRYKESNRIDSVTDMLRAFGIACESTNDTVTIHGDDIHGGTVDAKGDHRIAMAAVILASFADSPTTIIGGDCVVKSYPEFYKHYAMAGGKSDAV